MIYKTQQSAFSAGNNYIETPIVYPQSDTTPKYDDSRTIFRIKIQADEDMFFEPWYQDDRVHITSVAVDSAKNEYTDIPKTIGALRIPITKGVHDIYLNADVADDYTGGFITAISFVKNDDDSTNNSRAPYILEAEYYERMRYAKYGCVGASNYPSGGGGQKLLDKIICRTPHFDVGWMLGVSLSDDSVIIVEESVKEWGIETAGGVPATVIIKAQLEGGLPSIKLSGPALNESILTWRNTMYNRKVVQEQPFNIVVQDGPYKDKVAQYICYYGPDFTGGTAGVHNVSIEIPEGVTEINVPFFFNVSGGSAMYNNAKVSDATVILPETLQNISIGMWLCDEGFDCTVIFKSQTPPTGLNRPIYDTGSSNNMIMKVPKGCIDAYRTALGSYAYQWTIREQN